MDYVNTADYEAFRRKVISLTGIDLGLYKSQQMQRRIRSLLDKVGTPTFTHYGSLLERDPEELRRFCDYIMINVSEFFRNPEKFDELEKEILPSLLRRSPNLSIWSAGASNGAEIYSVAMILDDIAPKGYHKLLATDIDSGAIAQALAGVYGPQDVKNVSSARLARHFTCEGSKYTISSRIKSRVQFRMHNLLADRFERGFDLILCRNVVIYFTDEAKQTLYAKFRESLRDDGVLFIGGTETILNAREIGFLPTSSFFYRRAPLGKEAAAQ
ncbi:MAG TPA: protein-glutamate O-methyltransferase CheR [Bacillota bacterium]|jgi:chemotaxis protein methyltransferase CheR|nr:protein-glutamate O-methyltransferase CheR [Bacillota bacterium]